MAAAGVWAVVTAGVLSVARESGRCGSSDCGSRSVVVVDAAAAAAVAREGGRSGRSAAAGDRVVSVAGMPSVV